MEHRRKSVTRKPRAVENRHALPKALDSLLQHRGVDLLGRNHRWDDAPGRLRGNRLR